MFGIKNTKKMKVGLFSSNFPKIKPKPKGASIFQQRRWRNMSHKQQNFNRMLLPDRDGDKVPDLFDCRPFNPKKDGKLLKKEIRETVMGRQGKSNANKRVNREIIRTLEKNPDLYRKLKKTGYKIRAGNPKSNVGNSKRRAVPGITYGGERKEVLISSNKSYKPETSRWVKHETEHARQFDENIDYSNEKDFKKEVKRLRDKEPEKNLVRMGARDKRDEDLLYPAEELEESDLTDDYWELPEEVTARAAENEAYARDIAKAEGSKPETLQALNDISDDVDEGISDTELKPDENTL